MFDNFGILRAGHIEFTKVNNINIRCYLALAFLEQEK